MTQTFPYRFDRRWQPMFTALRVKKTDGVTVNAEGDAPAVLRASFGFLKVETTLDNVDHTLVTGPHRWYTAVGARLSFVDDGLTFGTNHHLGLCIAFKEKIPKVIGWRPHSALWVSVADPEGLAVALGR